MLTDLRVGGNKLKELPWRVGRLTALQSLHINNLGLKRLVYNDLTESSEFGKLKQLESCNLSYNKLHTLGGEIGMLTKLTSLNLSSNGMKSIPIELCNCILLTELSLSKNQLSDLPENFGNCNLMKYLNLSQNKLLSLPNSFGHLTSLKTLLLSPNRLSNLPNGFGSFHSLRRLTLHDNNLKHLPESFGKMTDLTELDFRGNKLVDLPNSFGGLIGLKTLNLLENDLVSLCKGFGGCINLTDLNLTRNKLESLPNSLGCCTGLTKLKLSYNQLKRLPDTLGLLTRLKSMEIQHNNIDKLPQSMKKLRALQGCNLAHNQLRSAPISFKTLRNWAFCDMTGNNTFSQDAKETTETESEVMSSQGRVYLKQKCFGKAIEMFTIALRNLSFENATMGELYFLRGICYYFWDGLKQNESKKLSDQERLTSAEKDFNVAMEAEYREPQVFYYKGLLLEKLNKPYEALVDANEIIKIKPDYLPPYYLRGRLFHQIGRYRDSLSDWNFLNEKDPLNYEILYQRALTTFEMGINSRAFQQFEELLELTEPKEEQQEKSLKVEDKEEEIDTSLTREELLMLNSRPTTAASKVSSRPSTAHSKDVSISRPTTKRSLESIDEPAPGWTADQENSLEMLMQLRRMSIPELTKEFNSVHSTDKKFLEIANGCDHILSRNDAKPQVVEKTYEERMSELKAIDDKDRAARHEKRREERNQQRLKEREERRKNAPVKYDAFGDIIQPSTSEEETEDDTFSDDEDYFVVQARIEKIIKQQMEEDRERIMIREGIRKEIERVKRWSMLSETNKHDAQVILEKEKVNMSIIRTKILYYHGILLSKRNQWDKAMKDFLSFESALGRLPSNMSNTIEWETMLHEVLLRQQYIYMQKKNVKAARKVFQRASTISFGFTKRKHQHTYGAHPQPFRGTTFENLPMLQGMPSGTWSNWRVKQASELAEKINKIGRGYLARKARNNIMHSLIGMQAWWRGRKHRIAENILTRKIAVNYVVEKIFELVWLDTVDISLACARYSLVQVIEEAWDLHQVRRSKRIAEAKKKREIEKRALRRDNPIEIISVRLPPGAVDWKLGPHKNEYGVEKRTGICLLSFGSKTVLSLDDRIEVGMWLVAIDGIGIGGMIHKDAIQFVDRKTSSGRSRTISLMYPGGTFKGRRQFLRECTIELGPVTLGLDLAPLEDSGTGGTVVKHLDGGLDCLLSQRGVRPGDELIAIDGVDITYMECQNVQQQIADVINFNTIKCTFAATNIGDILGSANFDDHSAVTRIAAIQRSRATRKKLVALQSEINDL